MKRVIVSLLISSALILGAGSAISEEQKYNASIVFDVQGLTHKQIGEVIAALHQMFGTAVLVQKWGENQVVLCKDPQHCQAYPGHITISADQEI